ncbi:MAG: IPT/TIG domain-containing protein [bacterium]
MRKHLILYLLTTVLSLVICGCAGDDNPVGPDKGTSWNVGGKKTYQISGNQRIEINDPDINIKLVLPEGGDGELNIAKINSGPEFKIGKQELFYLEYSGEEIIEVYLPYDTNSYNMLYSYRSNTGEIEVGKKVQGWWPVPDYVINGDSIVFSINAQKPVKNIQKILAYQPPPANYYAISAIPDRQSVTELRNIVAQIIELWLNYLPEDVAKTARQNITSTLAYSISIADACSYSGGNSMLWNNANFYLRANADLSVIAHEVGHYMTHVLLGFNRYDELQIMFRTGREHQPSDYGTRADGLLEDYAFFSEYLATGYFNSTAFANYDLSNVRGINNMADLINSDPQLYDYPSYESFPTTLWIALMRTQNEIYCFDNISKVKSKSKVPVISATIQDVIKLILRGPRTVDESRTFIQEYLDELGTDQMYKLPAMLEPLGWSYNGRGRIVDKNNKPIEKCAVQNISQVGGNYKIEEYRTPMSPYTGSDGVFRLFRIYPGSSILRVFYNYEEAKYKDSIDFPLNVDWSLKTNETIDLKDFKITLSPKITSILPLNANPGDIVTIKGIGFGNEPSKSSVTFNGKEKQSYYKWNDSLIECTIPSLATSGDVVVTANGIKSKGFYYEIGDNKESTIPISLDTTVSSEFEVYLFGITNNFSDVIKIPYTMAYKVTGQFKGNVGFNNNNPFRESLSPNWQRWVIESKAPGKFSFEANISVSSLDVSSQQYEINSKVDGKDCKLIVKFNQVNNRTYSIVYNNQKSDDDLLKYLPYQYSSDNPGKYTFSMDVPSMEEINKLVNEHNINPLTKRAFLSVVLGSDSPLDCKVDIYDAVTEEFIRTETVILYGQSEFGVNTNYIIYFEE